MVLEVLAHAGEVMDNRDAKRSQLVCRPDAGQQQQSRGVDRTARYDDLAACVDVGFGRLALGQIADARGATVLDDQLCRLRVGGDRQVRALSRRLQERGRRALSPDVALRDVVEADTGLLGAR